MASADISVAIESVIYGALKEAAQAIFDQHKIMLHEVAIEWLDVSTHGEKRAIVQSIRVDSSTKGDV